jgi:hypothetical protein
MGPDHDHRSADEPDPPAGLLPRLEAHVQRQAVRGLSGPQESSRPHQMNDPHTDERDADESDDGSRPVRREFDGAGEWSPAGWSVAGHGGCWVESGL